MIPCHSAALRCTWPFAVTCMTPSSIENEIAHLTVAAFSSHLSRLRREERLVMTAYGGTAAYMLCYVLLGCQACWAAHRTRAGRNALPARHESQVAGTRTTSPPPAAQGEAGVAEVTQSEV